MQESLRSDNYCSFIVFDQFYSIFALGIFKNYSRLLSFKFADDVILNFYSVKFLLRSARGI